MPIYMFTYIDKQCIWALQIAPKKELQSDSICGLSSDSMWRQLVFILLQRLCVFLSLLGRFPNPGAEREKKD